MLLSTDNHNTLIIKITKSPTDNNVSPVAAPFPFVPEKTLRAHFPLRFPMNAPSVIIILTQRWISFWHRGGLSFWHRGDYHFDTGVDNHFDTGVIIILTQGWLTFWHRSGLSFWPRGGLLFWQCWLSFWCTALGGWLMVSYLGEIDLWRTLPICTPWLIVDNDLVCRHTLGDSNNDDESFVLWPVVEGAVARIPILPILLNM